MSRDCVDQRTVINEFKNAGVEIIFSNHKANNTPESDLMMDVQGAVGRFELKKILEWNMRGKLHAAKKGCISVMSNAPYGYRSKRGIIKTLVKQIDIDLDNVDVVFYIKELAQREGKFKFATLSQESEHWLSCWKSLLYHNFCVVACQALGQQRYALR